MVEFLIVLGTLVGLFAGTVAENHDRAWSGDVPRQALWNGLPKLAASEVNGATFTYGVIRDDRSWEIFSSEVGQSGWGEAFWQPDVAWDRSLVLYAAHDGATHMLRFEQYRISGEGAAEFIFSSQMSRRPEGADGPCSVVLYLAERAGLTKVVVKYKTHTGEQVELGELAIEPGPSEEKADPAQIGVAQEGEHPGWQIERFQWARPLGSRGTIEIVNEYGDIRSRAGAVAQIEVSAVVQSVEGDPYEAKVGIDEREDRVVIEVGYSAAENRRELRETEEMKRRRVDLTVIFPSQARLEARTTRGLVEAKGLKSDVRADSLSGDIVISAGAGVQARTERGAIRVELKDDRWDAAPSLETVTGDISVWLPEDASVSIEAETEGHITTDYSVEIRRPAPGARKQALAKLGKGRQELRISSTRGNVSLFRSDW
jgi:hypothetical protein